MMKREEEKRRGKAERRGGGEEEERRREREEERRRRGEEERRREREVEREEEREESTAGIALSGRFGHGYIGGGHLAVTRAPRNQSAPLRSLCGTVTPAEINPHQLPCDRTSHTASV
eukprot:3937313-Rhodomonas_salina.1